MLLIYQDFITENLTVRFTIPVFSVIFKNSAVITYTRSGYLFQSFQPQKRLKKTNFMIQDSEKKNAIEAPFLGHFEALKGYRRVAPRFLGKVDFFQLNAQYHYKVLTL